MEPPGGSLEAWFERLFSAHGPSLRRLAGAYAATGADAEDLFQDIWLAVWRALPSFRGGCSERTFLFRIGHNRGISHRSHAHLRRAEPLEGHGVPDVRPDPSDAAAAAERSERLLGAVRALPPASRDVVCLSLEGLSNSEIADVLGISTSNVGVRLLRARRQLRDALGALEGS